MNECNLCGVDVGWPDENPDHSGAAFDVLLSKHGDRTRTIESFDGTDTTADRLLRRREVATVCRTCTHALSSLFQRGPRNEHSCDLCQRMTPDTRTVWATTNSTGDARVGEICRYCIGHLVGIFYGDRTYGAEIHELPVVEVQDRDEDLARPFEPTPDAEGYIYAIEANRGQVKIGMAAEPRQRLSGLQTGSPVELTLLAAGAAEKPKAAEKELHRRYADDRIRGEWFRLKREDVLELVETVDELDGGRV